MTMDTSMRKRWKRMVFSALDRPGVLSVLNRIDLRPNRLRVLVYHRIDEADRGQCILDPDVVSVGPQTLDEQMGYLTRYYRVISCQELQSALLAGKPLPAGAALVTFDDGYRDFLTAAWPVLQRWGIPAVLFVATGYVGNTGHLFWWDRLYQGLVRTTRQELLVPGLGRLPLESAPQRQAALVELKRHLVSIAHREAMALVDQVLEALDVVPEPGEVFLTWDELRELSAAGITIAAHTRTHPILAQLSAEEAREEIVGAQEDLRRELGQAWPIFCYPNGRPGTYNGQVMGILRAAGFVAAFTMIRGMNVVGKTEPLAFRRLGDDPDMTRFRLHLTGIYGAYMEAKYLFTGPRQ